MAAGGALRVVPDTLVSQLIGLSGGVIFAALVVHRVWRWRSAAKPEAVAPKMG